MENLFESYALPSLILWIFIVISLTFCFFKFFIIHISSGHHYPVKKFYKFWGEQTVLSGPRNALVIFPFTRFYYDLEGNIQRFSDGISVSLPFEFNLKTPQSRVIVEISFIIDQIKPKELFKYIDEKNINIDKRNFNSIINDIFYEIVNQKVSCENVIDEKHLLNFFKRFPELKLYLLENFKFLKISRIELQKWNILICNIHMDEIEAISMSDYISRIGVVLKNLKGIDSLKG